MTRSEALDRDPPLTGYQIRVATGSDGTRWLWTFRVGCGAEYTNVCAWRGRFWGSDEFAELDPPEVDRLPGMLNPT